MDLTHLTRFIKATFFFLVVLLLFPSIYLLLAPRLSLVFIPYLLLIFLVLRLLQFFTHSGYTYKNVTQLKHVIRICLFITLFTVQCGLSLNLLSYEPEQDSYPFALHKLALHQSKKNYILVRYVFSLVVYFLVHDFGIKRAYDGSNLHALQALTEISDCIIIFWEDSIFSLDLHYSPHLLVEKRPIEMKNIVAALLKHSGSMKILGAVLLHYDLFNVCTEVVVCYGLRNLFKRFSRRATSRNKGWDTLILELLHRKSLVYFVNGKKNILSFFFSLLIVYKFTQENRLGPKDHEMGKRLEKLKDLEDLTYNFLFLFIILWIMKAIVLLSLESNNIYDRFRYKMLSVSEQLYFLCILDCCVQNNLNNQDSRAAAAATVITEDHTRDRSLTGRIFKLSIRGINVGIDIVQTTLMSLHVETAKKRWRNKIREELLWDNHRDPTLDDLQQVAQHILGAKKNLSENYLPDILTHVTKNGNNRSITRTLKQYITWGNELYRDDHRHFRRLLRRDIISLTEFKTWLEKAHDDVISHANTLTNAKQVTEGLNKVFSVLLIGATVMAWLKALNCAEITKDFAIIASPFFAASFLIKDPLKDCFERIVFIYLFHPFDIGDLCEIDGQKVEVAAMGLWTTTFLAIMDRNGRRERQRAIIYPNSKLATLKIEKHATEFDWGDPTTVE